MLYVEGVTRGNLDRASRDELIELALEAHRSAEQEKERRLEVEQQLRWFKQQLFGAKSERRMSVGSV